MNDYTITPAPAKLDTIEMTLRDPSYPHPLKIRLQMTDELCNKISALSEEKARNEVLFAAVWTVLTNSVVSSIGGSGSNERSCWIKGPRYSLGLFVGRNDKQWGE